MPCHRVRPTPLLQAPSLSIALLPNARPELLPEAGLGRDRAQCLAVCFPIPPVENRACGLHRTRLSTCGRSPWGSHAASVSLAAASTGMPPGLIPLRRHPRDLSRGQLARALGTVCADSSVYSVLPKARGLRRGECAPCRRRYRPRTPPPHPPRLSGSGMSSGVSPVLLSTSLDLLREASRVPHARRKRHEGGGVSLAAPSALCGCPVNRQGRAGCPVLPEHCPPARWPLLVPRGNTFGRAWLAA